MDKIGKTKIVLIITSILILITGLGFFGYKAYQDLSNESAIVAESKGLNKFASCEEMKTKIKDVNKNKAPESILYNTLNEESTFRAGGLDTSLSSEFSGTNNQVKNVDEGDILKTDGDFIYTVSNDQNRSLENQTPKLNITSINPEDGTLKPVSDVSLKENFSTVSSINLFEDKLVVNGIFYENNYDSDDEFAYYNNIQKTKVQIFNIADRYNPELMKTLVFDGFLVTTRSIEGVFYIATSYNQNLYFLLEESSNLSENEEQKEQLEQKEQEVFEDLIPTVEEFGNSEEGVEDKCQSISYPQEIESVSFSTIGAIDLNSDDLSLDKEIVMGGGQNLYASQDNIYLASTIYNYDEPVRSKTKIYKFNLNGTDVSFQNDAEVPGIIINQFSMDEYENHFRIATTITEGDFGIRPGLITPEVETDSISLPTPVINEKTNALYILDENLRRTGEITGLAKNEDIYSVRFMGDRAFIVTFEKVDPLFTFDLSDHANPKVLGELKIPGYSDYLHPISDDLLIGIGKEVALEDSEFGGNFSWYQGVKIGLFDVSNMSDPKELDSLQVGDRGTESPALNDHKAFLWDERNNMLAFPVTLKKIDEESSDDFRDFGNFEGQGSFIFNIVDNQKIEEKGNVSHLDLLEGTSGAEKKIQEERDRLLESLEGVEGFEDIELNNFLETETSRENISSHLFVKRQFYINNYLITFSDSALKVNDIEDLSEVSVLKI